MPEFLMLMPVRILDIISKEFQSFGLTAGVEWHFLQL